MARARKHHDQLPLGLVRDKNGQRRGGSYRKGGRYANRRNPRGAGRKPNGSHAGVSHAKRPAIDGRHPLHITLRTSSEVGWLRKFDMYAAFRRALAVVGVDPSEFRIVHISVQNTHVHLICEAVTKRALSRGMRAFQISAAKHLNAAISRRRRLDTRRRGRVFTDRYHVEVLTSPTQVRNALAYVLNNWRRHGVDRGAVVELDHGRLDAYASGLAFAGWRESLPSDVQMPPNYEPPLVSGPATWLLRVGWMKARSISMFEIPGPRHHPIVDA
jgi:REP element-mobilizing transposase RayT